VDLVAAASKALEAEEIQDRDDAKESQEETSSTMSPPPALSEDLGVDKKRKRVEELASSSTSVQRTVAGETPILEGGRTFRPLGLVSILPTLSSFYLFSSFRVV
jgi:hypothetical protein